MKKSKSFLEQENGCVPKNLFGAEWSGGGAAAEWSGEKVFLEHKLFLFQKSFVFFACKDPLFFRFLQKFVGKSKNLVGKIKIVGLEHFAEKTPT